MEKFGALSNTFYRLVRKKAEGVYDVYDFHTTANRQRNMWIEHMEFKNYLEPNKVFNVDGTCAESANVATVQHERRIYDKAVGNKEYNSLKADGFVLVGKFEQDICGRIRRIK